LPNASLWCVSGIRDVVVDGTAYDVDFRLGTYEDLLAQGLFPFFGDQATTETVRLVINSQLNPTNLQRIDYGGASDARRYGLEPARNSWSSF
jgi:hypothetical protein